MSRKPRDAILPGMTSYAENRKARFDYEIIETFEAGIILQGFEVKAIKSGRANLAGTFALIKDGELFLVNTDIPPYQSNNTPEGYDPKRTRKLLIKGVEMHNLIGKLKSEKLTLVPLKLYNKQGFVKVEIALARGKKKSDKRETIRKRETKREIARTLKR